MNLGAKAPVPRIFQPRCVFTLLVELEGSASVIGAISVENGSCGAASIPQVETTPPRRRQQKFSFDKKYISRLNNIPLLSPV